ncbi:MAG: YdeI/OmpD-associated family protein [Bacteroidales bacterium]|nr:YdeI/OmpD-associated family protein [Bacteroidales bacterium]
MKQIKINPQVDKYLIDGCMRCKYGGTPQCKVLNWVEELELLRQIVLETGLTEEIKWSVPVYTHKGKNVVTVNALKESANIGFFKGVLLSDKQKILQKQGNIQSARIIKFTNVNDIEKIKDVLRSYVLEAIAIEESGKKLEFRKNPEPVPDELLKAFEQDPAFKEAFYTLTHGRQRGYIIHFSQPKQPQTRFGRIEKCKEQIYKGIGLND